jgi:hypothetical protein
MAVESRSGAFNPVGKHSILKRKICKKHNKNRKPAADYAVEIAAFLISFRK